MWGCSPDDETLSVGDVPLFGEQEVQVTVRVSRRRRFGCDGRGKVASEQGETSLTCRGDRSVCAVRGACAKPVPSPGSDLTKSSAEVGRRAAFEAVGARAEWSGSVAGDCRGGGGGGLTLTICW